MKRELASLAALVGASLIAATALAAPVSLDVTDERPDAIVDLATRDGVALVGAAWRYADAQPVAVEFRAAGADRRPSGAPNRTHDIEPKAGVAGFDDGAWPVVDPTTLDQRRGSGRLSFGWYRTRVTIPDRIGPLAAAGTTVVFEMVVDDYAEIWVDGKLALDLGRSGGALVAGFNVPNRVVLTRDARPGQTFEIAVLGINGPLSAPPANYIWVRSATLDFYRPDRAAKGAVITADVVRVDPSVDAIVPPGTKVERVATGFGFGEGPVWHKDGYLLLSDPDENAIYRWAPGQALSVFRTKSGYRGVDVGRYRQPGSNGLALDKDGRLTIAEHANRRVTRLEPNGVLTVLADRHEGRRLNSPNDLVYRSDGSLYFTDPPFGLPGFENDPAKELPFAAVFMIRDGRLTPVATDLAGPNGLAFSPDERFLYVANWDLKRKIVMRYPVRPDGTLDPGTVLYDMTGAPGEEALDGLKVDRQGNLFVSGPGGTWILSPEGRHLGMLRIPELPANYAWGDADGRTLYLTARTGLYRMRLPHGGKGS